MKGLNKKNQNDPAEQLYDNLFYSAQKGDYAELVRFDLTEVATTQSCILVGKWRRGWQ